MAEAYTLIDNLYRYDIRDDGRLAEILEHPELAGQLYRLGDLVKSTFSGYARGPDGILRQDPEYWRLAWEFITTHAQ